GALLPPPLHVARRQLQALVRTQPRGQPRDHPYRTQHHQARRRHLPTTRPTFVVAMAPEQVLQVIIRPGNIRRGVATEQPRPAALAASAAHPARSPPAPPPGPGSPRSPPAARAAAAPKPPAAAARRRSRPTGPPRSSPVPIPPRGRPPSLRRPAQSVARHGPA